jgi:phosphoribosylanthranilate isomerase
MTVQVKICGVNDADAFDAAVAYGADLVGFVFYPPSPRAVTPPQAAALSGRHHGGPLRVGLFVDPLDEEIARALTAVPLDLLQLHGSEDVARCRAVRARFGVPVMKALGIAATADLEALDDFAPAVDRFLLDAKPSPGATLPGGNAAAFDWTLLASSKVAKPWLLAGGLTPDNVADAIRTSGARAVDVSSGVERSRGRKEPLLIRSFIARAKGSGRPGCAA